MTLVVAIDGPAGAGKSTAAKALAMRLGFRHVDTGAMYRVVVAGRDLTDAIRAPDAGDLASKVSTRQVVRARLVALQRRLADGGPLVMEGRDIGTVVFPDAPVKVFLTAEPRERARRRAAELRARGEVVDEDTLVAAIAERDRRDSQRAAAPLRPAADALVVDTTAVDVAAVVERLAALVAPHLEG